MPGIFGSSIADSRIIIALLFVFAGASLALGLTTAAGIAVYYRRKRFLWFGIPLAVAWGLVLWFLVLPAFR